MFIFLSSTGLILLYILAAYGWGGIVAERLYRNPTQSIAFNTSLGLTLWFFLGGPFNLFNMVSPLFIDILLILGIFFSCILFYRYQRTSRLKNSDFSVHKSPSKTIHIGLFLQESAPALMIIAVTLFLVLFLLPSAAFNFHDDFYKYLPRIVRLIESGTLGGTPFDYVGYDSLGAQFYLQSFLANHFPLKYINGFDAVFCFLLGGLLLNDIGRKAGLHWYYRSGVVGIYILISPQYVNISSLYSGSLMVLSMLYAGLLFFDYLEEEDSKQILLAAIPIALTGATLFALKNTFVPYTVLYFALFFLFTGSVLSNRKNIFFAACISVISAGLILLPWIWAVSDKLVIFYLRIIAKTGLSPSTEELPGKPDPSILQLHFSSKLLPYGGTALEFSLMIICICAAALWAIYLLLRNEDIKNRGFLIVAVAAGLSATIAYFINVNMARNFFVGIRYSCPIIIGAMPVIVALMGRYLGFSKNIPYEMVPARKICGLFLTLLVALVLGIIMFDDWLGRLNKIRHTNTMISYPISQEYLMYMHTKFSESEENIVHSMQQKTEVGSVVASWFDTPFHLDFSRNKIFTISGAGRITSKEQLINASDRGQWLNDHFKSLGIKYVIWGYKGPPKEGRAHKYLSIALEELRGTNRVIYDDGRRAVFQIK